MLPRDDPKGLDGRTTLVPDGLVAQTGGTTVDNSNDFSGAVERGSAAAKNSGL